MEIGNLFVKVTSWDKRKQLKSNMLHGCCHSTRTLGGFWTLKLVFFMFRLIRFIRKFTIVISFSCWLVGFLVVGFFGLVFFVVVCLFVCFCVGKELSFSKISRSHQMVPGCPKSTNCPLTGLPSVTWIVLREELPSVTELLATVYYHHLCQILLCWTIAVSNNKESKYF